MNNIINHAEWLQLSDVDQLLYEKITHHWDEILNQWRKPLPEDFICNIKTIYVRKQIL